jgi:hypothetical protein
VLLSADPDASGLMNTDGAEAADELSLNGDESIEASDLASDLSDESPVLPNWVVQVSGDDESEAETGPSDAEPELTSEGDWRAADGDDTDGGDDID